MKDNVDLDGERDFLDFCYHVETKRFTQIMPYGSPYAITMDGDSHQRFTGVEFAPDGNFDIAFTITRKQALDVLKGLKSGSDTDAFLTLIRDRICDLDFE